MIARALRTMVLLELMVAAGVAHVLFWWHDWPLVAALAGGVAVPLATHAGIVALGFALARHARGPAPVGAGIGVAGALRTYLRELVDSIWAYQIAQPWLAGRPLAGEDRRRWVDGDPLPVVLIHGYLCNRQVWRTMASGLDARGHAIAALDLEPVYASIDDFAPMVGRAVDDLRARTGAPRVALVCHSMGGLVARAWLRAGGETARAALAAVITLGSPHRGTVHARLGQGRNARQMELASDWLRELAAAESDSLRELFTVVTSHHDNVVASTEPQTLPGARSVEFCGLGHLTLLRDAGVLEATANALRQSSGRNPR